MYHCLRETARPYVDLEMVRFVDYVMRDKYTNKNLHKEYCSLHIA